jgi:hypothetical protein
MFVVSNNAKSIRKIESSTNVQGKKLLIDLNKDNFLKSIYCKV